MLLAFGERLPQNDTAPKVALISSTDQGGGKRPVSISAIDFSKSESFHKRPAYCASSVQSLVDDCEIETSPPREGADASIAADGLSEQLDNIGIVEKASDLSKMALVGQLVIAFAMGQFPVWRAFKISRG